MFVQTNIRYCKFTNSNKQFCGRSNREAFDQVPIVYIYIYIYIYDKYRTNGT